MNEVEAVKDLKDIALVERTLERFFGERERDIWKFGINTALRISDLLNVRFADIVNDLLTVYEQKTGKRRSIKLNDEALEVVRRRQRFDDEYLFQAKSRNVKASKEGRPGFATGAPNVL